MRIRLFVDVMVSNRDVEELQQVVGEQPETLVTVNGYGPVMVGRFMGATMVEKEEHSNGNQEGGAGWS